VIFRSKHFVLQIGYDIASDAPFSIIIGLGHRPNPPRFESAYRCLFGVYWDWPKIEWAHEAWAVNEAGALRGLPIHRQGIASSTWTGRERFVRSVRWLRGGSFRHYAD
jgi:hypothetical protein